MIDFSSQTYFKLYPLSNSQAEHTVVPLLVPGEKVFQCYKGIPDIVVFTTHRLIIVSTEGFSEGQTEFTVLPYHYIQSFSIRTKFASHLDSQLSLSISGAGQIRFEFSSSVEIGQLCRIIGEKML